MKIIVRTKEKKLRLWLPGGLLYGRISARIAIAAITAIATIRATFGDKFFPAETDYAITAVTGFDADFRFIYEFHRLYPAIVTDGLV